MGKWASWLSHTRTVVREYLCDNASQWKNPKFDPLPRRNPVRGSHKNWYTGTLRSQGRRNEYESGGARIHPAQSAGKNFLSCPPTFYTVPP